MVFGGIALNMEINMDHITITQSAARVTSPCVYWLEVYNRTKNSEPMALPRQKRMFVLGALFTKSWIHPCCHI